VSIKNSYLFKKVFQLTEDADVGNCFCIVSNLRELIKDKLEGTDVALSIVSAKSGVPYGALYHFKTKGTDMRSEHLEKLFKYFTGRDLLSNES